MQPVREVYSLLMPVQGGRIIMPRAAVAEVMGYSRPKDRPEDAPAFLLGYVEWQNQRVPLVSFEAARGGDVPELGRRTRIAVVFGIAGRLQPNVFAVVTQGYPYLVRVNENVLHHEEMEADDPLVLARVRMANEKPFIPNLEQLEVMIADGLGLEAVQATEEEVVPVDELDALGLGDEEEFDAGLLVEEGDEAEADDAPGGDETSFDVGAETASDPDLDLGDVTSFGVETNVSAELDEISGALEGEGNAEESESAVDFGEVTSIGAETNYSSDLEELSNALGDEPEAEAPGDDYEIDLSGVELDEAGDDKEAGEIDFSDLEIDFGDEDDKKD